MKKPEQVQKVGFKTLNSKFELFTKNNLKLANGKIVNYVKNGFVIL